MFVDVGIFSADPLVLLISGANPKRVGKGLYTGCGFNFGNLLKRDQWVDPEDLAYEANHEGGKSLTECVEELEKIPSYGVVDSVEQFLELFGPAIEADPHGYAVGFTEVRRVDQPLEGGWRWHKFGQYYGKHEPQCEYLHDEPEIERVFTFSVMRRRDHAND